MSLPIIGDDVTVEQVEQALRNGSIILQIDGGDGHYGYDQFTSQFYFEFYGDCAKRKIHHGTGTGLFRNIPTREEVCIEWRYPPYTKYFPDFQAMMLWAAFAGMEWT